MTSDTSPTITNAPAGETAGDTAPTQAGCGCGSAPAQDAVAVHPSTVAAAPCCGTREAATAAGACCDPAAKTDALAAGASCCG